MDYVVEWITKLRGWVRADVTFPSIEAAEREAEGHLVIGHTPRIREISNGKPGAVVRAWSVPKEALSPPDAA